MTLSESKDSGKAFPSLFIKQVKRNVFHNHLVEQGMSQPEMCSVMKEFEVKKILCFFFSALFSYMDEGAEEEVRR